MKPLLDNDVLDAANDVLIVAQHGFMEIEEQGGAGAAVLQTASVRASHKYYRALEKELKQYSPDLAALAKDTHVALKAAINMNEEDNQLCLNLTHKK